MEVLTHEIETLKVSTKSIREVLPTIEKKLIDMQNIKPVAHVDSAGIDRIEKIINEGAGKLGEAVTIPRWVLISILSIVTALTISAGLNYYHYSKFKDMEKEAIHWYSKAVELGYKRAE